VTDVRLEIWRLVEGFFKDGGDLDPVSKRKLWMRIPNPLLGGMSPDDMIRLGKGERLHQFVCTQLALNDRDDSVWAPAPTLLYYIRDARQVVGNCALWWRPEGRGYTTEIREAGRFTHDEAFKGKRETDVPYQCEVVDKLVTMHVRLDHLLDDARGADVIAQPRAKGEGKA
jgi:hypothetical protein